MPKLGPIDGSRRQMIVVLPIAIERVAEADGGCRLALARRGGADRRDKDKLPVRAI